MHPAGHSRHLYRGRLFHNPVSTPSLYVTAKLFVFVPYGPGNIILFFIMKRLFYNL